MSHHLGEFEQLILWSVLRLGAEAYGVTIQGEIEGRTARSVSPGSIYTTLGRLESKGLVRSWLGESTAGRSGRRRKYYALEPEGAAALHDSYSSVLQAAEGLVPRLAGIVDASDQRGRGSDE